MSWDQKYSKSDEFVYGVEPNDFVVSCIRKILDKSEASTEPLRALVLGSGEGRHLAYLSVLGFEVTGVESSKSAILKSNTLSLIKNTKFETIEADVLSIDLNNSYYDVIVMCWLHLPKGARQKVLEAVKQSLKPEAYFILESFRAPSGSYEKIGPPTVKMLPELSELLDSFQDFNIIIASEVDRELSEGLEHQGMAEVIQLFLQKNRGS